MAEKLELVCELQKVKDLELVILLFLSDSAFAVYKWLSEDEIKLLSINTGS